MCPLEYGLGIFGGKWKSRILCVLSYNDVIRYMPLRKELGNIADAVLAAMLKELTEDALVERRQFNEIPPKVEYFLSKKGKSVLPILQSICLWSGKQSKDKLDKKLLPCKNCPQAL